MIYTHKVTLEEALSSAPIMFTTLDGRRINVNLDQLITPQVCHLIKNEGMPVRPISRPAEENGAMDSEEAANSLKPLRDYPKGNLYLKFDIEFPNNLTADKKQRIVELLH